MEISVINRNGLYDERVLQDMVAGKIHIFTPVTEEGVQDPMRPVKYAGSTNMFTNRGPMPVAFDIEAQNLPEALTKWEESLRARLTKIEEEVKQANFRNKILDTGGRPLNGKPS